MIFNLFNCNQIISKEEQNYLLEWTFKNSQKFKNNPVGPHRKFCSLDEDSPHLFEKVKDRIIQKENLSVWFPEPEYGDFVGWISNGGFIHHHIDMNHYNLRHVRYNLFLSVPHKGGIPTYNGKKIAIKERCYVRCNSGSEYHSCSKVIGSKPRIVISYGFLI